jgi:hypothetical protein
MPFGTFEANIANFLPVLAGLAGTKNYLGSCCEAARHILVKVSG